VHFNGSRAHMGREALLLKRPRVCWKPLADDDVFDATMEGRVRGIWLASLRVFRCLFPRCWKRAGNNAFYAALAKISFYILFKVRWAETH